MKKIDYISILEIASKTIKPICLIGFMGCGKSYMGTIIAQKSEKKFIDLDIYLSEIYNKSIPEIFENEGEKAFRLMEKNVLNQIISLQNIIIATGGGTPCFFDNMNLMIQNSITVYLKTSQEKLFERLVLAKSLRPLISKKNDIELFEYIIDEVAEREKYYYLCDYLIEDFF